MESIKKQINRPLVKKITNDYPVSVEISADFSIDNLLAVNGTVFIKQYKLENGRLNISAQTIFTAIYKENSSLLSYESGADLSYQIENANLLDGQIADIFATLKDIKLAKTDAGANEITANLVTTVFYYTLEKSALVEDIEDCVVKCDGFSPVQLDKTIFGSFMDAEGERQFSFFIEKVLCHKDQVKVNSVTTALNEVIAEGEIYSEFVLLTKSGERIAESLITPFRFEIECENSTSNHKAVVFAQLSNALFKITAQEGSDDSLVVANYTVEFKVSLFSREKVAFVTDAFSITNELEFERANQEYLTDIQPFTLSYKAFGEGDCAFDKGEKVLSSPFCNLEITDYDSTQTRVDISGLLTCQTITQNEKGELSSKTINLPFNCKFECDGQVVALKGYSRKHIVRNLDGKCLIECETIFVAVCVKSNKTTTISEVVFGEEKEVRSSAISVVFINKGDDLWSVCKKACAPEQVILADNPNLTFPVNEDKAVVVYRKIN